MSAQAEGFGRAPEAPVGTELPSLFAARLTDEEVDSLARRVVTNEVYLGNTEAAYQNAFGTFLIFAAANIAPGDAEQVGAMWEEYAKAGPRSVNGHPVFFSAHFLHRDDLPRVIDAIERKQEALTQTAVPSPKSDSESVSDGAGTDTRAGQTDG